MKRKGWTAQQRAKYAATMAARNGRRINGVIDLGPRPDPEVARIQQALTIMRGLSDPARNYVLSRAAEGEGVD